MSQIIRTEIFSCTKETYKPTRNFLASCGMTFGEKFTGEILMVELIRIPEVMRRMYHVGIVEEGLKHTWMLLSASKNGILIYLASPEDGDGYVFIPTHNIVCIHSLSDKQLMPGSGIS